MIPTSADLRSGVMTHKHGDVFNAPALTNFLGCVQTEIDPTATRSLNVPPFGQADAVTGRLFVDDVYAPALGRPIDFVWQPDRVERTLTLDGLTLHSTTVMPMGRAAVVVALDVTNTGDSPRTVRLRWRLHAAVTSATRGWASFLPPTERDNERTVDAERGAYVFTARHSAAVSMQGVVPRPERIADGEAAVSVELGRGETRTVHVLHVLADSVESAATAYDELAREPQRWVPDTTAAWDAELAAAFTPGNDRFGGHLPTLETDDEDLRRLYWTGIVGTIYFRRDNPLSMLGRSYDTLMPRYWQTTTFLWDYSLSSMVHAQLDPVVARRHLEHWMGTDVNGCMATEWINGEGLGLWYAVNDYAMVRTAREYVRWTGDHAWLKSEVPDGTGGRCSVLDKLAGHARAWERIRSPRGLADYGELGNLLECVSSYVHEVAALNAANVWSLRQVADLLDLAGRADDGTRMRGEATALLGKVLELYADGQGYWNARFPDGHLEAVRHCYDFLTVGTTIAADLPSNVRTEMVGYFQRELQSPTWMRALSAADPDAVFSVRPDHQWNGAYPAWPPESAQALIALGRQDVAMPWMRGLAQTGRQGPYGQAHFVDDVLPPDCGGALKAPCEEPYISDWHSSSSGSWASLVVEGVFGVRATVAGELSASPNLDSWDPAARLSGLSFQGRRYDVSAAGAELSGDQG